MRIIGKIIAVNAALIAVLLVVAELIFGSWITGPEYSVLNIPRNTVRHFDVSELYPGYSLITYTRDEHGLRGKYKTPKDIDVVVMGGSTTNEIFVPDGETWVDWLSKGFAMAGKPLTIVNAAVDGQSSLGHIRAIDLWFPNIPGLKPRYVLIYVGINDQAVSDKNISKFDEMKSPDPLRRFRYYLMNHSVLYNRFRQIRGMFVAQRTRLIHGAYKTAKMEWKPVTVVPGSETQGIPEPVLAAYRSRLSVLAQKIREDMAAEPVFITQKRGEYKVMQGQLFVRAEKSQKPSSAQAMWNMQSINRATLEICAKMKLTCVDLAREISFQDGDFYDQIHTSPSGSRRIGEFIYQKLKNKLK